MSERIHLRISSLKEDLSNGLARCVGDPGYDSEIGSIQEKYNLSKSDVKAIFQHPKLKGLRKAVIRQESYELIDDIEEDAVMPITRGSSPGGAMVMEATTTYEAGDSVDESGVDIDAIADADPISYEPINEEEDGRELTESIEESNENSVF